MHPLKKIDVVSNNVLKNFKDNFIMGGYIPPYFMEIIMDIKMINDLIDELEQEDLSLSNIRNLSALYTVKKQILGNISFDNVVKELNDILPSYEQYINIKRKYQMRETTINNVETELKNVCREIKEFIQTLYSGTDDNSERILIKNLVEELRKTF